MNAFPYMGGDGNIRPMNELWSGTPLDTFPGTDIPYPSMINTGDCIAHIILGASVGNPDDVAVVEMGTFWGAASICTAAGLALSKSEVPYHAYDFFKMNGGVKDMNYSKLHSAKHIPAVQEILSTKPHSYESVWNLLMNQVYPPNLIHSHAGKIGSQVGKHSTDWGDSHVGLFIIDSAKRYPDLVQQSHAVWQSLRPGSVVIFSDFMMEIKQRHCRKRVTSVPGFVYSSLVETGLFKLLWVFPSTSEVAFEVTDKYNPSKGLSYLKNLKRKVNWKNVVQRFKTDMETSMKERGYSADHIKRKLDLTQGIFRCESK